MITIDPERLMGDLRTLAVFGRVGTEPSISFLDL